MAMRIGTLDIPEAAVLAPMAGFTDLTFRLLCKEMGCGLVYTELVSAKGLLSGGRRSLRLVETDPRERPIAVQLYGASPEQLAKAAHWVEENVPCDMIDLNMGCPVTRIVSRGEGAALMRDPRLVERLVRAVHDAVTLPVTAKIRAGWSDAEINAVDVSRAIEAGGSSAVAVHARTRSQKHEGRVDFSLLADIKKAVTIPVLGNGGIKDAAAALYMRNETGVDAVMVARGALGNPWIFRHISRAWDGLEPVLPTQAERLDMLERHLRGSVDSSHQWARKERERRTAEGRGVAAMRGHLLHYVEAGVGTGSFRRMLNDLHTVDDALAAAHAAFSQPGNDQLDLPASANPASENRPNDPPLPVVRRPVAVAPLPVPSSIEPSGLTG